MPIILCIFKAFSCAFCIPPQKCATMPDIENFSGGIYPYTLSQKRSISANFAPLSSCFAIFFNQYRKPNQTALKPRLLALKSYQNTGVSFNAILSKRLKSTDFTRFRRFLA